MSPTTSRLSPATRATALAQLTTRTLDVLVIGGGVVGAGAALDAVTRGLTVGLIEMRDWGSGSSSRSGRLIDGGLAELPRLSLVSETLRERDLLLDRLAPHLVKRVPLLRPLHHGLPERVRAGAALAAYDGLAAISGSREVLPAHRQLAARTVRRIAPALDPAGLTGGLQRYEAQVDDARLGVTLVRTAAGYGAHVASRVRVDELMTERGRVVGVRAYDRLRREPLEIRARVVVAAAGAWNEVIAEHTASPPLGQRLAVYLVVPRDRIRTSTGLELCAGGLRATVLPWGRHWIIGPGTGEWTDQPTFPLASATDIQRLLDVVNVDLAVNLTGSDVEGSYASSWPVAGDLGPPRSGPSGRPGLVFAASPALTRYRLSAAAAIDAATIDLGGLQAPSITERVPLAGADGYHAEWNQRHLIARRAGLHVAQIEHLLDRYGSLTGQLLDLLVAAPELAAPLDPAADYLCVEALYAVTHEGARHLTDILARRTRLTTQARDGGASVAPYVAELVSDLLGWDASDRRRQIRVFLGRVQADRRRATGGRP